MAKRKIVTAVQENVERQDLHVELNDTDKMKDNISDGNISDLSEQESLDYIKTLEKQILNQKQQIHQMNLHANEMKLKNEQLLTVISEKDKFFTIIAHDLKNPLQALKGFIQILYEELNALTMNEIFEIVLHIKSSTNNFSDLLENLMLWARLQRGLMHFNQEEVFLNSAIRESVSLISDSAANKNIELAYAIPGNIKVFADINILHTIVRNLISNAVKFTLSGGKINIRAKMTDGPFVELSISDTGIGMSPEMVRDLFLLDTGTSRNGSGGEPGTGLGLIICKDFIENQGGKLWVESEESKGSTFYFTLPVKSIKEPLI
jgi:signal transduction histidine kinase